MATHRSVGFAVVTALALIAPLIAGAVAVFAFSGQSPLESAATAEPLVGQIESAERYQDVQVAIAVEEASSWSPTTHASGTLTAVLIGPESTVSTGTVIATVNDASLVAYAAESPLFRDISRGSTGRDVATAQAVLVELGFASGDPDGKAGMATEKAIIAFNSTYGYGEKNPMLSLASLAWVGPGPVTVATTELHTGAPLAPGDTLFTTTAGLASITVTEPATMPRDADLVLVVGAVTVPYEADTGRVTDADAVTAVSQYLAPQTEGVGTIRLAQARVVGSVPASAVVSDAGGGACVFPDATSPGIVITPTGGTLGTVDLDPSLIGTPLLLNPREVRTDLSCGG